MKIKLEKDMEKKICIERICRAHNIPYSQSEANAIQIVLEILEQYHMIKIDGVPHMYFAGRYIPVVDNTNVGGSCRVNCEILGEDKKRAFEWMERLIVTNIDSQSHYNYIYFANGIYNVENDRFVWPSLTLATNYKLNAYYPGNYGQQVYLTEAFQYSTPCFDKFLDTITNGENELKELFLDHLAYVLCNERSSKRIFVLYDKNDTGRKIWASILQAVVGMRDNSLYTAEENEYDDQGEVVVWDKEILGAYCVGKHLINVYTKKDIYNVLDLLCSDAFRIFEYHREKYTFFPNKAAILFETNDLEEVKQACAGNKLFGHLIILPFSKIDADKFSYDALIDEMPFVIDNYIIKSGRLKSYMKNGFRFPSDVFGERLKMDLFGKRLKRII